MDRHISIQATHPDRLRGLLTQLPYPTDGPMRRPYLQTTRSSPSGCCPGRARA